MDGWSSDQYSAYDLASMNTFEGQYQAEQQGIPAQTCFCNNCKRKYPQHPRPRMEINDIATRKNQIITQRERMMAQAGAQHGRILTMIGSDENELSTFSLTNPMVLFFIFVLVVFLGSLRGALVYVPSESLHTGV